MAARKAKPWAVILLGPGVPEQRTEHTSSAKAYQLVNDTRTAVRAGTSPVTRIRVEQWEPTYRRWARYEFIDPKEQQ
jgi:hypothetical protein